MLNIVVISPIYKIVGREEVFKDSESVHDLVKYWGKDNNVKVFFPYIRGVKHIFKFFNPQNINYYFNGYDFNCDNISVTMIDWQKKYPQQNITIIKNTNRVNKIINRKLTFSPDVVLVHIPSAYQNLQNNKSFNAKKIAVLHYTDVKYFNNNKNCFIDYLNKNYDAVFCRSKSIYNIFKQSGLNNLKSSIIYSGVPVLNIDKNCLKQKFSKQELRFLYVGKLIERKNLDILIKALNNCTNFKWTLDVIGAGPMEQKYKELVENLKLTDRVKFLGTMPKDKVFKHMENADIFCMPSVRETLGLVYIEAMANGCITIGTVNEGIDGIIKNNENGFLVEPNVEDLTNTMQKIYNYKDDEKKEIINNAILTAKKFNELDMSKAYLDNVRMVVNKNGEN